MDETVRVGAIRRAIMEFQGDRPWGRFLDAGTGKGSMEWLLSLETEWWTAVTADPQRERAMRSAFRSRMRPRDRIVRGAWSDDALLAGEVYDVVMADYLLGAVDCVAPYFQEDLFARLRRHVSGRLYVDGLEPFRKPATEEEQAVVDVIKFRDACSLLAGERPFREYPLDWTVRALERSGYRVLDARVVPCVFHEKFVTGTLDGCRQKIGRIRDRALAAALERARQDLQGRATGLAKDLDGLHHGFDWVVAAEP